MVLAVQSASLPWVQDLNQEIFENNKHIGLAIFQVARTHHQDPYDLIDSYKIYLEERIENDLSIDQLEYKNIINEIRHIPKPQKRVRYTKWIGHIDKLIFEEGMEFKTAVALIADKYRKTENYIHSYYTRGWFEYYKVLQNTVGHTTFYPIPIDEQTHHVV